MGDLIQFHSKRRCNDCDEWINPRRLSAVPDTRTCTECGKARENVVDRALKNVPLSERAVVEIRF